jgi:hypothetical protein
MRSLIVGHFARRFVYLPKVQIRQIAWKTTLSNIASRSHRAAAGRPLLPAATRVPTEALRNGPAARVADDRGPFAGAAAGCLPRIKINGRSVRK